MRSRRAMHRIAGALAVATLAGVGTVGMAMAQTSTTADPSSDVSTLARNVPESSTDVFHGAPGVGGGVNRGVATIVGGRITQGFSYLYTGLYLGQTETTRGTSLAPVLDDPVIQTIEAAKNVTETFVERQLQVGVGDALAGPLHPAVGPVSDQIAAFPR